MSPQDNNTKIIDPFLLEVLEQHRGQPEFTDILRSIQSEQNEIVDHNFNKNIIVQGCAGSGKTMILFHRLANILYNIKSISPTILPNRIAIIIPNDNFRDYIKNLTWSLGVDNIQTYTMDEYLLSKLENIFNKIFKSESSETMSNGKSKRNTSSALLLQRAKGDLNSDFSESKKLTFKEDLVSDMVSFISEYETTHKKMRKERAKERDEKMKNKKPGKDSRYEKWRNSSLAEIREYRKEMMEQFIAKFLDGKLSRNYIIKLLNAVCSNQDLSDYRPDYDDLLMIDEGQDYSYAEYDTLKAISPDCIYNIYGDTNQKIFERGLEEWGEIQELFDADYFELNQDYRNSSQIVDFVNSTFNKNILSVGFSTKDVEEVDLQKLPVYLEYEEKLLKHNIAIISEQPEIYSKIPDSVKVLTVKQVKGLEFDTIFISPEIADKNDNYRYVSYTRALSHLYLLK